MKLSFLIQMMLLLLLVVGTYLLFTNSIQGKMKLIMIVFCLVVGVYLFSKLPMFKDHNELIENIPQTARNQYIISGSELLDTDGSIGLSCWIYIDNWNYNYGKIKHIISSNNEYFPKITLDPYKNDLKVSVKIYDEDALEPTYTQEQLKAALEDKGYSEHTSSDSLSCSSSGNIFLNDTTDTGVSCPRKSDIPGSLVIENINIQKWVNIITTFNNRTLDVYINGKLVKSKPFNNVIVDPSNYKSDILITPNGGFGGFVSNVKYFPYFITPAKAWSIYRGGFGSGFESALNKYNLSVAFYEDHVERGKYYIF